MTYLGYTLERMRKNGFDIIGNLEKSIKITRDGKDVVFINQNNKDVRFYSPYNKSASSMGEFRLLLHYLETNEYKTNLI